MDKTDSLQLARVDREKQGQWEAEYSYGGEADLHRHYICCSKNPGHTDFIPVDEFTIQHLPEGYRDTDIMDYIRVVSDLTVRVTVKYVSDRRPENFPGTDNPYPGYADRGRQKMTVGTGWVHSVHASCGTCKCCNCRSSSKPETKFAIIDIATANHVVFDDQEGAHATCHLFFDNGSTPDNCNGVITLTGMSSRQSNTNTDWCYLQHFTHDLNLTHLLQQKCNLRDKLVSVISMKLPRISNLKIQPSCVEKQPLLFIASHPHGCRKHISIGRWVSVRSSRTDVFSYQYTTATCPGSSGARVYMPYEFSPLTANAGWSNYPGSHCGASDVQLGINCCHAERDYRIEQRNDAPENVSPLYGGPHEQEGLYTRGDNFICVEGKVLEKQQDNFSCVEEKDLQKQEGNFRCVIEEKDLQKHEGNFSCVEEKDLQKHDDNFRCIEEKDLQKHDDNFRCIEEKDLQKHEDNFRCVEEKDLQKHEGNFSCVESEALQKHEGNFSCVESEALQKHEGNFSCVESEALQKHEGNFSCVESEALQKHEGNFSCVESESLQKHEDECQENPDHQNFVPANEFSMNDLPPFYRKPEVMEFIKSVSAITVHLSVNNVSEARPKTVPGTVIQFPWYTKKGRNQMRVGSGGITKVVICQDGISQRKHCQECQRTLKSTNEDHAYIYIGSTVHLVYDRLEAEHVICRLCFDSDDQGNNVFTFADVTHYCHDVVKNKCNMIYVTRDLNLANKLKKMTESYEMCLLSLKDLYNRLDKEMPTSEDIPVQIKISHSRGGTKQIIVSYEGNHDNADTEEDQRRYALMTCPCSVGAPVIVLGWEYCYPCCE